MLASPEVAAALEVEIGSPLIGLTRTVFAADGARRRASSAHCIGRTATRCAWRCARKVSAGVRRWSAVLPTASEPRSRGDERLISTGVREQSDDWTALFQA